MATVKTHKKIGLLGGSFNPAHSGHMEISKAALKILGLDEIWWIVSAEIIHKETDTVSSFAKRCAKSRSIIDTDKIVVKDLEISLKTTYTFDTIRKVQKQYPDVHFLWIMGADNFSTFDTWYKWQEIIKLVPIVVFHRPTFRTDALQSKAGAFMQTYRIQEKEAKYIFDKGMPVWLYINTTHNVHSSTNIRKKTQQY